MGAMGARGARVPSLELDRLVATRDLQLERPSRPEFEGLLRSAEARLPDAEHELNSMDSRFDLAYNTAHALALAALRCRDGDEAVLSFDVSSGAPRAPSPAMPPPTSKALWV